MNRKWEQIIDSISCIKEDSIDKEKIKSILKYDHTIDTQVIDNLYLLKVLTVEEYKNLIDEQIERSYADIHFLEERLKGIAEIGERFSPIVFYGFGKPYRGAAVEIESNKE